MLIVESGIFYVVLQIYESSFVRIGRSVNQFMGLNAFLKLFYHLLNSIKSDEKKNKNTVKTPHT